MGNLAGKVALVTGASRGIGKGCALALGAAGATVYVTGRAQGSDRAALGGSLGETVQAVASRGGHGIAVPCDHANDEEVEALFARIERDQGRLDVLVNNAFAVPKRMDPRTPFWQTPISDWDVMIDVGTRSAYVATHHAAQSMVRDGSGVIVNVSSAGAVRYFHHIAYGIGKAALDRMTKDAARPLAEHRVAIVAVWPYLVRTERVMQMPGVDETITESPEFTGRGIVALASDPDVMRWSGRAVTTHGLAEAYNFTDVDGRL
ncbi:MAG: SDR family NAD(P)-dependent oxidoreductase, partial [Acidimicrobiia bacterium]|nr:SDR family NAD(P)-dependent oxidoreductase [Acidimicrobiia bacterium]